jgi:hypothetical protein
VDREDNLDVELSLRAFTRIEDREVRSRDMWLAVPEISSELG